jgi:MFS family permease
MVGSAFAGGLVAVIGAANALVVDAVSFGLSAAVLAWSTRSLVANRTAPVAEPPATPEAPATPEPRTPYLTQLREGWDFLRADQLLLGIALMVAVTNLLDLAYVGLLVPVWARESGGGAAAIGLLFGVFSGASAIGAVTAATWAARLPRFKVYLFAFLICGSPRFFILGFDTPLWAVLAFAAVAGFGGGFINPVLGAVMFERIPQHLMGRVTSLSSALCFALMPFGGLLGGVLVGQLGLAAALFVCGAAYFLATMAPAVNPQWREMDRRPGTAAPEPLTQPLTEPAPVA